MGYMDFLRRLRSICSIVIPPVIVFLVSAGVYIVSMVWVESSYSSKELIGGSIETGESGMETMDTENTEGTLEPDIQEGLIVSTESASDSGAPENLVGIRDGIVYEEAYFGKMKFDESKYSMGYDLCWGIPESVYDTRDIQERVEFFFADRYSEYEGILNNIQDNYEEYFDGLVYDWVWNNWNEESAYTMVRSGEFQDTDLGTILNSDTLKFEVVSLRTNDSEAEAIYFFNDYYVVYEVKILDGKSLLIVVDYSKTAFRPDTEYVTFRGIINNGFSVYKENSNYRNIDGWDVIFVKHDPGRYFDRDGKYYSGEDIANMAGQIINW